MPLTAYGLTPLPPSEPRIDLMLVREVRNESVFGARAHIPAFIAKYSGQYIVRVVQPTTVEGDWKPERLVIIQFPERGKGQAFLSDPEIQALFKGHHDATTSKLVLVDGCT